METNICGPFFINNKTKEISNNSIKSAMTMGAECMLTCELCCAVFKKSSNLKRHISNVHFPERKFMCEHCSKSYNTKCSLIRHISKNHSGNPKKISIVYWQCPICIFTSDKEAMVEHYRLVHNLDTSPIIIKFDSEDEFQNWKQNIENESCSKYIRYRNKKCSDKLRYFYRCHRDGFYKSRGKNVRRLKKIGSNKINAHCPAKIDVTVNEATGKVSIKYMKNHLGHKLEMSRLSLTYTDRKFLTKKPIDKVIKNDEVELSDTDHHNEADIKTEIQDLPVKKIEELYENTKTDCLSTIPQEIKDVNSEVEVVKISLKEKFNSIISKINNLKECGIISKDLSNLESTLCNSKNLEKLCTKNKNPKIPI